VLQCRGLGLGRPCPAKPRQGEHPEGLL